MDGDGRVVAGRPARDDAVLSASQCLAFAHRKAVLLAGEQQPPERLFLFFFWSLFIIVRRLSGEVGEDKQAGTGDEGATKNTIRSDRKTDDSRLIGRDCASEVSGFAHELRRTKSTQLSDDDTEQSVRGGT